MRCAQCNRAVAVERATGLCLDCLSKPAGRAHKYGAVRTEYGGRSYPSKAQADYAAELDQAAKLGAIRSWEPEVTIRLVGQVRYRADARVVDADGSVFLVDVKGAETSRFRIVRQLWPNYGPCPLHIVRRTRGGWKREIIEGKHVD